MSIVECLLSALVISLSFGFLCYVIGSSKRVKDKTCEKHRESCIELFTAEIDKLTKAVFRSDEKIDRLIIKRTGKYIGN